MPSLLDCVTDRLVPVQIHPVETREGGVALQFEHPTIAGVTVGGWMNRADAKPKIVQVRWSCARLPCSHCVAGCRHGGSIV